MAIRDPFAEKAELLDDNEVLDSFQATAMDQELLKSLFDRSARIIIGARGSGKSMAMRRALVESRTNTVRPSCVYINFHKYLTIEPFIYQSTNALGLFRSWVITKIFLGVIDEAASHGFEPEARDAAELSQEQVTKLRRFVEQLEGSIMTSASTPSFDLPDLSVEQVLRAVDALRTNQGRERAVLLMDDAAHAFSPDFQEEFFEVFRLFRTIGVSAKAAVYPGATHYGRTFNPGHDALETRVEREVESPEYESFISSILTARLSRSDFARLSKDSDMLTVLCFAASGNPRSAIIMAREVVEAAEGKAPQRLHYKQAIDDFCNSYMWKQHESLRRRLPRFDSQVTSGSNFVHTVLVPALRALNSNVSKKQTANFAVEEGATVEFDKVLSLLQYAGIVHHRGTVRRGRTRPLTRYQLHLAIAISQGAFVGERGAAVPVTAGQLRSLPLKRYKTFTKDSKEVSGLLKGAEPSLPPCPSCGKRRLVSQARFCSYCGQELKEGSVYLQLLSSPINALPLPEKKIAAILEQGLLSVKDIVMDTEGKRLRKAKGVGTVWASRIRNIADEFLEG